MNGQARMTVIPAGDIPFDKHRTYLAVFASDGGAGVTMSFSGSEVHVAEGTTFQFFTAPINQIEMVGDGMLVYCGDNYS